MVELAELADERARPVLVVLVAALVVTLCVVAGLDFAGGAAVAGALEGLAATGTATGFFVDDDDDDDFLPPKAGKRRSKLNA